MSLDFTFGGLSGSRTRDHSHVEALAKKDEEIVELTRRLRDRSVAATESGSDAETAEEV